MSSRIAPARIRRGILALVLLLSSCVATGGERADAPIPERDERILIGAFNFSENQILAELYSQTLEQHGFDAHVLSNVGPREIIEPALEQEQIDIAVEYLGAALAFLDPEGLASATTRRETLASLRAAFGAKGVSVMSPAAAENRNEFVVTAETAEEFDLRSVSDLQKIDSDINFGGPPECPARPLCLEGLERTYQLEFASFVPLDSGGPQTIGALEAGDVDVALLFTTNPALTEGRLVALEDDRGLQPPENILHVIRDDVIAEYGEPFLQAMRSVTRRLTSEELRKLNTEVEIEHDTPAQAAFEWLEDQGIS